MKKTVRHRRILQVRAETIATLASASLRDVGGAGKITIGGNSIIRCDTCPAQPSPPPANE